MRKLSNLSRVAAIALVAVLGACSNDGPEPEVLGKQFEREAVTAVPAVEPSTTTAPVAAPAPPTTRKPAAPAPSAKARREVERPAAAAATGWQLRATVASGDQVPASEPVAFTVGLSGNAGRVQYVELDFGDGPTGISPEPTGPPQSRSCPAGAPRDPSDATFTFRHTYREPGQYPVRVTYALLECNGEQARFPDQPMMLTVVADPTGP